MPGLPGSLPASPGWLGALCVARTRLAAHARVAVVELVVHARRVLLGVVLAHLRVRERV